MLGFFTFLSILALSLLSYLTSIDNASHRLDGSVTEHPNAPKQCFYSEINQVALEFSSEQLKLNLRDIGELEIIFYSLELEPEVMFSIIKQFKKDFYHDQRDHYEFQNYYNTLIQYSKDIEHSLKSSSSKELPAKNADLVQASLTSEAHNLDRKSNSLSQMEKQNYLIEIENEFVNSMKFLVNNNQMKRVKLIQEIRSMQRDNESLRRRIQQIHNLCLADLGAIEEMIENLREEECFSSEKQDLEQASDSQKESMRESYHWYLDKIPETSSLT